MGAYLQTDTMLYFMVDSKISLVTLPGGIPHFPGQQHLLVNERYWWQIKRKEKSAVAQVKAQRITTVTERILACSLVHIYMCDQLQ